MRPDELDGLLKVTWVVSDISRFTDSKFVTFHVGSIAFPIRILGGLTKDLPSPHLQVHCTWRPLEPGALSYSFPPRLAAVQEIAGLLPLTEWHTASVCPQIP